MTSRIFSILVCAAIVTPLLGGVADAGQSKDNKAEPSATKTVNCIPLTSIRRTNVLDDKTILFEMRNGVSWRNELPYKCHGLKFEDRFSYETSLNRLCSTDIITVIPTTGIPGPSCGLGKFVQYKQDENKDSKAKK